MRAELRPSSLGEILDRTAQMYRSHFLLYFGIASISYAAVLVLSLLADVLLHSHAHANTRIDIGFSAAGGHRHRTSHDIAGGHRAWPL